VTAKQTDAPRTGFRGNGPSYQDLLDLDSKSVPASLRRDEPGYFGDADIPVERYLSREFHELEKTRLWSRVWQFACREEVLAEVGDTEIYDICDTSILLVRAAAGPGGIKAYYNACLHRGRTLRDQRGHVDELLCPFHGFCWSLNGRLKRVPSAWDFPQVHPGRFRLPEVRVGTWGGFVFINPDPGCEPLEDFLGELPTFFDRWPLEDRYTRVHVSKILRVNWKVAQEAFMESLHVITTHPQLLPGFADANSQYDVFGNVSRAISARGVPSPYLSWAPDEQQRLNSQIDQRMDDPPMLEVPEGSTARQTLAQAARRSLGSVLDQAYVETLTDAELVDSYFLTVFPNMHPWGGFNQITYRFRPNGDDHRSCIMDVLLLSPFQGRRPPPVAERRLGPDEPWRGAVDELGSLARVFDQDEFNLEAVQKGLRTTRKRGISFAVYQESKIRHFHHLLDRWLADPIPNGDGLHEHGIAPAGPVAARRCLADRRADIDQGDPAVHRRTHPGPGSPRYLVRRDPGAERF
jgi:phenylpropionate dioxygenase-like ring-hydroxylating dioxygenase large terminal subunit